MTEQAASSAKKLLLLGSTGMLGQALAKTGAARGFSVLNVAVSGADINMDVCDDKSLTELVMREKPDIIINCVAIVSLNFCEQNPGAAYKINARPSAILAPLAKELGGKYIYISTDHYYSGKGRELSRETDPVTLLNEYARTKYTGEIFAGLNKNALIARTNIIGWRGWPEQPTFLEWVVTALKKQVEITMFSDYYTSSIMTTQFAPVLFDLIAKDAAGIYNLACRESFSKQEFITALAQRLNISVRGKTGTVSSLSGRRADSLGLSVSRVETLLGYHMPSFNEVVNLAAAECHQRG
jgi:dTDP-4-dehydrorhamnose reductase